MKPNTSQLGVTIIEMLVAITIIAILAVGMFTIGSYVETQSKEKLAQSTIETLVTALEQYYDFYNKFPDEFSDPNESDELYKSLILCPEAKKTLDQINSKLRTDKDGDGYLEIRDPWEKEFRYTYNKIDEDNFPVITSTGPDKKLDSDDDITSK